MPDLSTPSKIAAFNRTYAGIMCTNGGVVSAPFTFNNSLGTFRVTCINNTSVDTDPARCTYSISGDAIDGGLTTLSSLNNLNGGLTTLSSLNNLNGGLTTLTTLNSITTLDGGINGNFTTLSSLSTLDGGQVTSGTTLDGAINGGLTSSNFDKGGVSGGSLTSLNGEVNTNSGTGNKNIGIGGGSYSISGSVIGDNTDIANVPVKLIAGDTTLSTTTDSSGRYSFSGLGVGSYQIKPENKDPYIFYSANTQITDTNIQGLNFSGINLKKVDDPNIAELLRRGTENTGTENG